MSHDPGLARHADRVVAVRDGKLATETVRQKAAPEQAQTPDVFHEMAVLDSAGRLQIPKEYLEHFKIKRRAQLEMTEHGILVRPVEQAAQAAEAEAVPMAGPTAQRTHWLRDLVSKWRILR